MFPIISLFAIKPKIKVLYLYFLLNALPRQTKVPPNPIYKKRTLERNKNKKNAQKFTISIELIN